MRKLLNFVMRYNSFLAGCFIMLGAGAGYSFGAYSQRLAEILGYTQSEVYLAPSLGGIGVYLGAIVNGILMDKIGAVVTALCSGVFLGGGWALLYFASMKQINHTPEVLGIFYAIQQFGAQGGFYAAFVGNLGNFKVKHRGTVTGILVSMYGLSALMISQLYAHVFSRDPPTLFAFMALFTVALCITGACALRVVKPYSSRGTAVQPLKSVVGVNSSGEISGLVSDGETELALESASPTPESEATTKNVPRYGQLQFKSLLVHPDFWILSAISFCTAGSGLTFITIVGSVASSWGATNTIEATTYTSILSICNCAGRLIYGFLNDAFRKKVRSPVYLISLSAMTALAHFMMIFWMDASSLMIGTVMTGLSYGGFFATINLLINKYYGDENYATNLGFNVLVISLSGLVWGQFSGKVYDHFAIDKKCFGAHCYRYTFIATSALCLTAVAISIWLVIRERRHDERKKKSEEDANYFSN